MRKIAFYGRTCALLCAVSGAAMANVAWAKPGDPIALSDTVTIDPIIDGTLRYETVDQESKPENADALTMRIRAGAEIKMQNLSILAEAEGTLAIINDYDDLIPVRDLSYPVVADPENVELNRLQMQYSAAGTTVTAGRQRIILDDSRFVGNVGWRQNEQTFDAVRAQTKFGPVALDATYAFSQRTIFGNDSPNEHFNGEMYLINGGVDIAPVKLKAFAYLIDYDTSLRPEWMSTQTYGFLATGAFPVGEGFKLNFLASYAKQYDYAENTSDYDVDYIHGALGASVAGFGLSAGYEELGATTDGCAVGDNCAFQTPLATLHKFNGWADVFLTTPATGLRDYYGTVSKSFDGVSFLPGLKAAVTYHKFESDLGGIDYGDEWDASVGFKVAMFGILAKYANYSADDVGSDIEKFWLQASFSY